MCRFAAYLGPEIYISSLVTEPKHSLIHQSYHAKERIEPLNGDGFGIGWYAPQFCDAPALYKEVSPAWNNKNLRDIARVTKSSCVFAHVRAATIGGQLSRANCHPFSWKNFLFMHNGTVFDFAQIKRELRSGLSDEAYDLIQGDTDSEHIFALFVDKLGKKENLQQEDIKSGLLAAMEEIERLKANAGVSEPSTMNLVLADGKNMVATRYVTLGEDSNSLYYISIGDYSCRKGESRIAEGEEGCLVVSEPLNDDQRWQRVENNHLVAVDANKNVTVDPIPSFG